MGAMHSCCAYSSPRTDRGGRTRGGRSREAAEAERYEPRQNSSELGGGRCQNLVGICNTLVRGSLMIGRRT